VPLHRLRKLGAPLAFGLGLLIGCILTAVLFLYAHSSEPANQRTTALSDHDSRMNSCISSIIERTKPPKVTTGMYEQIWRICGNQIFNSLYLDDFTIRREKFIRQELDERVNLFLVVIITLSGVILAGMQLVQSFKLASAGRAESARDSEIAIESGRISLKSSITGAIILALSFAFFMVYVVWIYSIHEVPVGRPDNLISEAPAAESGPTSRNPAPHAPNSPPLTNEPRNEPSPKISE
jgi:hypothetical protein